MKVNRRKKAKKGQAVDLIPRPWSRTTPVAPAALSCDPEPRRRRGRQRPIHSGHETAAAVNLPLSHSSCCRVFFYLENPAGGSSCGSGGDTAPSTRRVPISFATRPRFTGTCMHACLVPPRGDDCRATVQCRLVCDSSKLIFTRLAQPTRWHSNGDFIKGNQLRNRINTLLILSARVDKIKGKLCAGLACVRGGSFVRLLSDV